MAINEYMMELLDEMVNPDEFVLEDQVDEDIETQMDISFGVDDADDFIIMTVAGLMDTVDEGYINFKDFEID